MATPEIYNLIALTGLLLGKAILLMIIVYYCCKRRPPNPATSDSADQTDDMVRTDIPPSYSKVVLRVDPPEYIESVINEQINPVMNKEWAGDMQKKEIDPQIAAIITRSRNNSISVDGSGPGRSGRRPRRHSTPAGTVGAGGTDQESQRQLGVFWIGI